MFEFDEYPETVIEIFRILYFSGKLQTTAELRSALNRRGVDVETRTVRYHLTNLEKNGLVRRYGNRGVMLLPRGVEEAKMLLVFDRVGGLAMETERLSLDCDYEPRTGKGSIMVNTLLVDRGKIEKAMEMLSEASCSGVILSSRLAVLHAGERMWNCEVPEGKNALIGVSSRNYDIMLQQARIPTETSATFLYRVEGGRPRGIADIISHSGTTLSPGELLIRGKYTSVSGVVATGSGLVTAAIKTFPSVYYDEVKSILESLDESLFSGLVEVRAQIPQSYRMSYKDRNRGYLLVYGGANFFAPLVEQGIAEQLSISHSIYQSERMLSVKEAAAALFC